MESRDINRRRALFVADMINFYGADPSKRGVRGDSCKYKGDNGTKCQIGRYIPDNKYNPGLEAVALQKIVEEYEVLPNSISELGYEFLRICQQFHDTSGNWTNSTDTYSYTTRERSIPFLRGLNINGYTNLAFIINLFKLDMPLIIGGRYLFEEITDPPKYLEDFFEDVEARSRVNSEIRYREHGGYEKMEPYSANMINNSSVKGIQVKQKRQFYFEFA